jgi:hypothetical protein
MNEDWNTAVPLVEPLDQECPECHCIGWHGPSCSATESRLPIDYSIRNEVQ